MGEAAYCEHGFRPEPGRCPAGCTKATHDKYGNPAPETPSVTLSIEGAICDAVVDHRMWIDDDGQPLDYLPEREARIGEFVREAADAVERILAARVEADRAAVERVLALADRYEAIWIDLDVPPHVTTKQLRAALDGGERASGAGVAE